MLHVRGSEIARLRARAGVWAGLLAALVILLFVPGVQPGASATSNPVAGSQGTDTSLPSTSSPVTVSGSGPFASLRVTVNQTKSLGNQAISVSWTGGAPTISNQPATFGGNYLQIFECWSAPTSSDPLPPPSPSQCEFGGEALPENATTSYPISGQSGVGFEYSRALSQPSWSNYGQVTGWKDPGTGYVIEPFKAVDGTVVNQQANYSFNPNDPTSFWLNQYFSFDNTNEIDFARTNGNGDGQQLFQVDTGIEAPGLGCGQAALTLPDGSQHIPDCWLVIVPRGTASQENPPEIPSDTGVVTSPLNPVAWSNRIAIPLQFKPIASTCGIGANEERIVGSELATTAVSSWQPALCATPGVPPFNYSHVPDDQARQDLTRAAYGGAGMAVFSDPIEPSAANASNPVVNAPLTLSGAVIGFNIERTPALVSSTGQPQPDEVPLSGTRIRSLYLTPRLVAKLLTESYQAELPGVTSGKPSAYAWVLRNPVSLVTDPDFLQYNPEFTLLSANQKVDAATLIVEESSSDTARAVWNWVSSDPEAKAWLNGQPDEWGMKVNPIYSTNPAINPSGAAFGPSSLNSYPKSDPYCQNTGDKFGNPPQPASPLCVQSWSPYALTMNDAAQAAADANDRAKTTPDPGAMSADTAWTANGPQKEGTYFILSVTDSASAAQFGLQDASLSRSGDDAASRNFVAPDEQSFLAGESSMTPSSTPAVLLPNPAPTTPGAYPLTMLTYAATTPQSLNTTDRQNYAAFLKYAASAGQTPGDAIGQLPPGYAPLPAGLQAQTLEAAATILNPVVPGTPSSTPVEPRASGGVPSGSPAVGPAGTPTNAVLLTPAQASISPSAPRHSAPSTSRTSEYGVGAVRWALPIGLIIGLTAGVFAPFTRRTTSRRRIAKHAHVPKPMVFEPW